MANPGRCPGLWLNCPFGAEDGPGGVSRRTNAPPLPLLRDDKASRSIRSTVLDSVKLMVWVV